MLLFLQSASAALRTSSIVGSGCDCPWVRAKQVFGNPRCGELSFWNENRRRHETCTPDALVRGSARLWIRRVRPDISGLLVDYRRSFSLQEFYDFVGVFGLHSNFYQGRVKML
jgi:hypothetical protein